MKMPSVVLETKSNKVKHYKNVFDVFAGALKAKSLNELLFCLLSFIIQDIKMKSNPDFCHIEW